MIQILMELKFLLDFVKEETGKFQTEYSIKIFRLNYDMKSYDPPLNDS